MFSIIIRESNKYHIYLFIYSQYILFCIFFDPGDVGSIIIDIDDEISTNLFYFLNYLKWKSFIKLLM